jgi:hypothetical protein
MKRTNNLAQIVVCLLFALSTSICSYAQYQYVNSEDETIAFQYAKKFTEDDVLCARSYNYFTFDKGKNDLGDKVVEITQETEAQFISLKKFASVSYAEFYNQFIDINTFKRYYRTGKNYKLLTKTGIDRALTDDGIFFDDSRVRYTNINFTQKGASEKVEIKKTFKDGKYLTRLFFNEDYPIKEQIFEFKVPEWVAIEFKSLNFKGHNIETTKNTKGSYTIYTFKLTDIPAYKSEYRRVGRANVDPHIVIQLKSFEIKGEAIKGFDKVDDIYAWNNRLYKMAKNDNTTLKPLYSKITENKKTDEEKIKAVYYWVQDNIKYIAYENGYSGYTPATVQEVAIKKYGDCKGMANLLTELLKIGGYDARFTWIGTKALPYQQSLPALCVNNHAICALNFKGQTYYLDGTESYAPFGEDAFRIQGKEAMIANADKFEIKKVPAREAAQNVISTKADFTLTDNTLKGKAKVLLTGNQRTGFHQSYQDLSNKAQKEYLNDYLTFGNDNLTSTNVKTSDLSNRDIAVTIDGDIDLSNAVNTISGDKYVGIDFFPKSLERLLPDEKRINGYDIDDVLKFEDIYSLTVPTNKKFIDKPDDLILKEDKFEFKGVYSIQGNKIILTKELLLKDNIISKEDFPKWTKFIEAIKEFNKYLLTVTNK